MRVDLRSDTFTRPCSNMLDAMMQARVGDDVFGEDPTVNELEARVATMFGKDAALFCPSGTMTNQVAIKCHTKPGDEVICEQFSHVYIYEGGGIAFNSSCQVKPLAGDRGRIHAGQVSEAINPDDVHKARTSLVCLENTSNRGGGSCYKTSEIQDIKEVCLNNKLKLHLDGARLWNALVATGEKAADHGRLFDSISVCLSKGLGAPVGSLLVGDADLIKQARRIRKVLGGGMRQAGYLAAAGLYALGHNINRLQHDHEHCRLLAGALMAKDFISAVEPVETNILIGTTSGRFTAPTLCRKLAEMDIHCLPIAEQRFRMVTHLDVTPAMIDYCLETIKKL